MKMFKLLSLTFAGLSSVEAAAAKWDYKTGNGADWPKLTIPNN
jgi:hypothetical protein